MSHSMGQPERHCTVTGVGLSNQVKLESRQISGKRTNSASKLQHRNPSSASNLLTCRVSVKPEMSTPNSISRCQVACEFQACQFPKSQTNSFIYMTASYYLGRQTDGWMHRQSAFDSVSLQKLQQYLSGTRPSRPQLFDLSLLSI